VPFALALALLGCARIGCIAGRWCARPATGRTWLIAVTPQAIAIAVFGAGAVLLFSGATPGYHPAPRLLRDFVPLPVLELSHLLGSAVGVGLLVLANGLYRRLDAAWWLTLWLLCAGHAAVAAQGLRLRGGDRLTAVAGLLIVSRGRFRPPRLADRAALLDPLAHRPRARAGRDRTAGGAFAYRHIPYDHDLWWQFAFEAPAPTQPACAAPRARRGSGLRPVAPAASRAARFRPKPGEADLASATAVIRQNDDTTANLALLGDKNLLFNADRTRFHHVPGIGRSWVAMGDPVGPEAAREALAWDRSSRRCDTMAASPVFYQVTPENLPLYVDLGLSLTKLGEEARIPLASFSLEGGASADLRQTHRRAARDGARFEVVARAQCPRSCRSCARFPTTGSATNRAARKRFSLGYFDEHYLGNFDCAVVRSGGASSRSPICGRPDRASCRWT
jgi:phosphatidylglycerol lysyltransferase